VLGKPGAGKTTLLRHIVMREIQNQSGMDRLPIFVSLHEVANRKLTIMDGMEREFAKAGLTGSEFLIHLLQSGQAFVLFDGLDEVGSSDISQIVQEIMDICARFPNSKFVVTCRTAAYSSWLETFVDVEIADFSPNQVQTFVTNWFSEMPTHAETCWRDIKDRPNIFQLATTPLLLALVCISYEANASIADTRADLYRDAIDVLLRKWDSSRLINREQRYKALSPSRKEALLSFLAARMFHDERYFFTYAAARDAVSSYVLHLEDINEDDAREDAAAMLDAIESQHGILVTRAKGVYSFAHLTFQEYFTAVFLSRSTDEMRDGIVEKHLEVPSWREVLILIAHLLSSADNYVVAMLKRLASLGLDSAIYRGLVAQMQILHAEEPTLESVFREPRGRRPIVASSKDRYLAKEILDRILVVTPRPKVVVISARDVFVDCLVGQEIRGVSPVLRSLTDEEMRQAGKFRKNDPLRAMAEYRAEVGEFPKDRAETEKIIDALLEIVQSFGFNDVDLRLPISERMVGRSCDKLVSWYAELDAEAGAQVQACLPNVPFANVVRHVSVHFHDVFRELKESYDKEETVDSRRETASPVGDDLGPVDAVVSLKPFLVADDYRPPSSLLCGAAVLAEILSTSVFLRKEVRHAALAMLRKFPFERPPSRDPPPDGPVAGVSSAA
jgi:hypothetical protein